MTERPILFSDAMVRALLDGTKTQTRRVVKNPDFYGCLTGDCPHERQIDCDDDMAQMSPYGKKGDRLWVRETFHNDCDHNRIFYRADADEATGRLVPYLMRGEGGYGAGVGEARIDKWTPSIFMRRRFSRILLELSAVRIERLQDISEEDAKAEGISLIAGNSRRHDGRDYSSEYASLWDSLNAKRGFGWSKNPWVWVLTFKMLNS